MCWFIECRPGVKCRNAHDSFFSFWRYTPSAQIAFGHLCAAFNLLRIAFAFRGQMITISLHFVISLSFPLTLSPLFLLPLCCSSMSCLLFTEWSGIYSIPPQPFPYENLSKTWRCIATLAGDLRWKWVYETPKYNLVLMPPQLASSINGWQLCPLKIKNCEGFYHKGYGVCPWI